MAQTNITTGQYVSLQMTAASVLSRITAWIIDALVIGFGGSVIYLLSVLVFLNVSNDSSLWVALQLLVVTLPILFYPFACENYFKGQSLGKRVMSIQVVNLDGSRPSTGQLLLRWLLLLADGLLLGPCLGLLAIIFTRNSQRLGDLVAGTVVVRTRDYSSAAIRLSDFLYNDPNYRPFYPEAANLSWRQVETIANTLHATQVVQRRSELVPQLAEKVRTLLDVHQVMPPEQFLQTIVNDYYYYDVK